MFLFLFFVLLLSGKGKPILVVDGSGEKGFKRWRKMTLHPVNVTKTMTAQELLVSEGGCVCGGGGGGGGGGGERLGEGGVGEGKTSGISGECG